MLIKFNIEGGSVTSFYGTQRPTLSIHHPKTKSLKPRDKFLADPEANS